MNQLPIIDISPLQSDRNAHDTVRALREACESVGFFFIVGHGVPEALRLSLIRLTREFFSSSIEAKQRISMEKGGRAWRGWFPVGGELTSGLPDIKEGLYLGSELTDDDPRVQSGVPMHGANLFPEHLPEMRSVVLYWMSEVERVGQLVLRGLALGLGLEPDFFARGLTRDPLCLFRIFHYPETTDPQSWGVGEHTDYGLLTLLLQDERGGLEVKTRDGWCAAPPVDGSFVCNLGDMLDRITGGRYRSTPHRVRNTSGASRYSWPFFLDPGFDAEVLPLPGVKIRPIEEDAAARWDKASVHELSGTYGEYLLSKVSRVFPSLQRQVSQIKSTE